MNDNNVTNFSNRNKFKILVHFDDVNTFEMLVKSVTFGGITLGTTIYSTPMRNLEYPGDSFQAEDAVIDFYLDENWESFKELFRWMKRIKSTKTANQNPLLLADMTVQILNTKFRDTFNIILEDCFPYSLTTINLDTDDDAMPLMGQVIMKVNDMDIVDKN